MKKIYSQSFFFLYATLKLPYKRMGCSYLLWVTKAALVPTSFPGSLILPSPGALGGGKMRDTGNEVALVRGVKLKNITYSRGLLNLVQHKSLSFIEH